MNTQDKAKAQEERNNEKLRDTNSGDIKPITVVGEEVVEAPKAKKRQAQSISYALKAIGGHVETLTEDGLLVGEEVDMIKEIVNNAVGRYTKREFGI